MVTATAVLDASALLALLNSEPGADRVAAAMTHGAAMSAVNYSEVIAKLRDNGMALDEVIAILTPLSIQVIDFTTAHAARAGDLRPPTRAAGLSLGDRACLALADEMGAPALTTDRGWERLTIGVTISVIR